MTPRFVWSWEFLRPQARPRSPTLMRLGIPVALAATIFAVAMAWPGSLQQAGAHQRTNVTTSLTARLTTTGDPVVLAAGDIACDPSDASYNGGLGTSKRCQETWTANELSANAPTAVLPLGDTQYNCGTLSAFDASYDPTWGQQKAITYPVVGNHEYATRCAGAIKGAAGYFTYFGVEATPLQPTCTAKCEGYYSYTLGAWHMIALNSECTKISGGCAAGSPEETWLRNDLSTDTAVCTLAYWHRPLFTSGTSGGDASMQAIFQDLYTAHVSLVLNGHDHEYERFAPQDANGNAVADGVTEFVVGTGGANHGSFVTVAANSVVRNSNTFGVLELTLHATSYDWQFIPDGHSGSFTDSGSAACV